MIGTDIVGEKLDYGNIPCGIVVFRKDNFKIVYSNDVYKNVFGTDTEYINVYIDDTQRIKNKLISDTDEGTAVEYRFIDRKGKINCAFMMISCVGEEYAIGATFSDTISYGVYNVYKEALDNDKIMVMELDLVTDVCRIVCAGVGESVVVGDFSKNALEVVFEKEEDVKYIRSTKKTEESYALRLRAKSDGSWQWYVFYKNIVCDENGNPIRIVGTLCNIEKQKQAEESLISKIETDPLTKVYSREFGKEKIDDYLAARTKNTDYALFVLDLDNFKIINDTFGHLYGDAVLTMAASCIKSSVDKDDIVGRFGGDEFFVFVKNSNYETIMNKAEKINKSILSMRTNISDDNDIACSIGIAYGTKDTDTYAELFRMADIALYKSKSSGKNCITVYTSDMQESQGGGICYEQSDDVNENQTQSHDLTHVAIEIAARSTSFQNAVHMIMRHIGLSIDVDDVKIMRVNYDDDRVSIEHHWSKVENVAERDNRTGYYLHEDVVNLRKKFEEQPLLVISEEIKEGFSQKFSAEIDKLKNKSVIYASSLTQEKSFYYMILSCFAANREWSDETKKVISDVTKILFVYLKKNYSEIVVPDDDPMSIEPHTKLLYFDKFFEQSGLIRKMATENNQKVAVIHTDFYNMHMFRRKYGVRIAERVMVDYAAAINREIRNYKDMCISTHVYGTDQFVSLIRYNDDMEGLAKRVLEFNKHFCEKKQEQYPEYKIITETGIAAVEKDISLNEKVDDVRVVKRSKPEPAECINYIVE